MMAQNHNEERDRLARCSAAQPKPRVGRRQTVQSARSECQQVKRPTAEVGDGDMKVLPHAAIPNRALLASLIRARMAVRLNFRLNMADAW